jgi:hypothetical protein
MWHSHRKRDEMITELISFPKTCFGQIWRRRRNGVNCLKPDLRPKLIEKSVRTSHRTQTFNSSPLSWVTAHLYWVIVFRPFGTQWWSHIKGWNVPWKHPLFDIRHFRMRPKCCPEKSDANQPVTMSNVGEERGLCCTTAKAENLARSST